MNLENRKLGNTKKKLFDFADVGNKIKGTARINTPVRNTSRNKVKAEEAKTKVKSGSKAKRIIKKIAVIFSLTVLFGFLFGILFVLGLVSAYSKDLPDIDTHFAQAEILGKDTIITDRNGVELYRLQGDVVRERVKLEDIPTKLQWAFLAAEDDNFKNHKGLDLFGVARAVTCAAKNGGQAVCGGGSSITQQLIKNTTDLKQNNLKRKIKEAVLAMKVEQNYSKDYILEFYLNVVPEGGVLEGVKSGSKYMFGKENLNDLTLAEMAFLAAIPNEPTVLSPLGGSRYDKEKSVGRAEYVLDRMLALKEKTGVTAEEIEQAKKDLPNVEFKEQQVTKRAPHYVDYVMKEVLNKMYEDQVDQETQVGADFLRGKGYVIKTAVDVETQELLQGTLKQGVESEYYQSKVGAQNAAAVIIDPRTGEVLSIVGSRDYSAVSEDKRFAPKFNAADAMRTYGSSVKPIVYLNAVMQGYHPGTILPDVPIDLGNGGGLYQPQNFNRQYGNYGQYVSMRTALKWSLNVPAVEANILGGIENFAETYIKLHGWEEFREQVKGPSSALGSANLPLIKHVHAYATLANEGYYNDEITVLEIKDDSGKITWEPNRDGKQVIEKKHAFIVNDMNAGYYLFTETDMAPIANQLQAEGYFGGKTGTGDNSAGQRSDLAFVGYTPTFVLGIWSGNNCGAEECPLIDGSNPDSNDVYTELYQPFVERYMSKIEPKRYDIPEGVVRVSVCSATGRAYTANCPGSAVPEYAADDGLPRAEDMVQKVWVTQCGEHLKLARQVDKDANLAEEKSYIVYKIDNPWLQGQMTTYQRNRNELPPTEECDIERNLTKPEITIITPSNNTEFKSNDVVRVSANIKSDIGIQKVEIYLDNILQGTMTAAPYEQSFVLPNNIRTGKHTITVVAQDKRGDSKGEARAEVQILINNGGSSEPTPTPINQQPTVAPTTIIPTITIDRDPERNKDER